MVNAAENFGGVATDGWKAVSAAAGDVLSDGGGVAAGAAQQAENNAVYNSLGDPGYEKLEKTLR